MVIATLITVSAIAVTGLVSYVIAKYVNGLIVEKKEREFHDSYEDKLKASRREKYSALDEQHKKLNKEFLKKKAKTLKRSKEVLRGQAYEQITPYLEEFDYYPGDCRFLGSPIDLVVFDGAVNDDIKKVVLVEVKTGNSRLNKRQKQIKDAVKNGRVEWLEHRIDTEPVVLKHKKADELPEGEVCLCNDCVE